ncbi:MAG: hypothetical protein R3C16_06575 [Hyphomonadaceae bacterium]
MSVSRPGSTSVGTFVKTTPPNCWSARVRQAALSPAPHHVGGVTDIYQPIERGCGVTRAILEVMEQWRHPVARMPSAGW